MAWLGRLTVAAAVSGGVAAAYVGLVSGALALDVGVGRRTRQLGPQTIDIAAPQEVVFDVIAQPYLGRTTRAMREKVRVLERGSDMVLAAHSHEFADRGLLRLARGGITVLDPARLRDEAG